MQTKLTVVLECEVNLIVVRANHLTAQEVTVVLGTLVEIRLSQIVVSRIIATCWSIKVHSATIAVRHFIKVIFRTILVGLAGVDALSIREADLQALQDFAPSKIVGDTTIDGRVRIHVFGEVTMILQNIIMICSQVIAIRSIADAVWKQSASINILREVVRTGQQTLVVFRS